MAAGNEGVRPQLDPSAMLVFAAIARARGIRGAAAALGLPRSTVSRRLAVLEDALGAQLVVRTTRRFALTDLGAALTTRCDELEALLHASEDLVSRASAEPSGTLRVAVAPVLGEEVLPEICAALVARHPRLEIDARLSVDYVDLRRGAVDVALRAAALADATDLYAVRVGTSVSGCWVSPAYAAAHGIPATPTRLADHPCLLVGSATPTRWRFRVGGRDELVEVAGRIRVDSFRVACALAIAGAGVVHTAQLLAEPFARAGLLVPVLERYWPRVPIFAVHAGPNPPLPKVRAFIDLAKDAVRRTLAAL